MTIQIVTPPAEEPITVDEVKQQIGRSLAETTYDTELNGYIKTARQKAEDYTARAIISQGWHIWLDRWPPPTVYREPWWDGVRQGAMSVLTPLPSTYKVPGGVLSAAKIFTIDRDDVETEFPAVRYRVDLVSVPGRLALRDGWSWPTTNREINGIRIEVTVGWADAASVPQQLKQGMLFHCQAMWEGRGYELEERKVNEAKLPEQAEEIYRLYTVDSILSAA